MSPTIPPPNISPGNQLGTPLTPQQLRRETSSSIASNLASARGIPPGRRRRDSQSLAQLSPQTAEGRVVNPPRRSKLGEFETKPSAGDVKDAAAMQSSPLLRSFKVDGAKAVGTLDPPPPIATAASEEPFSRFYSTFNNLINTLSAPLAFAGLPLSPNEATATSLVSAGPKNLQQIPSTRSHTVSSRASADPDLARLFSRAALRAMRDENGLGPVTESFYVVPTTGGTMSYANMLGNTRQASNLTDDDPEAEFVDARETPLGSSPVQSRHSRHRRAGSGHEGTARQTGPGSKKTMEELTVENETLKNVVIDLGDRLRAFELGAQKSSIALHASIRQYSSPTASSVVPGGKIPPMPGSGGAPVVGLGEVATKGLESRIRELEEELKVVKKDNRKLGRENQKYLGVIEKYRERWEALKEGARERVKVVNVGGPVESTIKEGSREEEL